MQQIRLALLFSFALLAAACGNDAEPELEIPPGVDPEAYREFLEAPVPPPVTYGESRIRDDARERGLFADLPEGTAANVVALLKALPEARQRATDDPGDWGGSAAGPTYQPSDAEIVLAEIGRRIAEGLAETPSEDHAAVRAESGLEGDLVIPSLRVVTVKVFGTGPVETVEPTSEWLGLGP